MDNVIALVAFLAVAAFVFLMLAAGFEWLLDRAIKKERAKRMKVIQIEVYKRNRKIS